jgi:hypothetical protein
MKNLLLIVALILAVVSCKKEDNAKVTPSSGNNNTQTTVDSSDAGTFTANLWAITEYMANGSQTSRVGCSRIGYFVDAGGNHIDGGILKVNQQVIPFSNGRYYLIDSVIAGPSGYLGWNFSGNHDAGIAPFTNFSETLTAPAAVRKDTLYKSQDFVYDHIPEADHDTVIYTLWADGYSPIVKIITGPVSSVTFPQAEISGLPNGIINISIEGINNQKSIVNNKMYTFRSCYKHYAKSILVMN